MSDRIKNQDRIRISKLALQFLKSSHFKDFLHGGVARTEKPVEIHFPEGKLHSWFVPVTAEKLLIGFIQILADGTLMRCSSFQRRAGDLAGCPEADGWLNPQLISSRVGKFLRVEETTGIPYMTFDKSPDRVVWAVPVIRNGEQIRLIFVAGTSVFLPQRGDSYD